MISFEELKEIYKTTNKSVILKQERSPLIILSYESMFEKAYQGSYDSHPDRIRHSIKFRNVSNNNIVAVRFGLAAFDTFNCFMGKLGGMTMDDIASNSEHDAEWKQDAYAAFMFEKYGTGVAYIDAVRAENGAIWRADMTLVLEELRKFEQDLKMEDLKEKTAR